MRSMVFSWSMNNRHSLNEFLISRSDRCRGKTGSLSQLMGSDSLIRGHLEASGSVDVLEEPNPRVL